MIEPLIHTDHLSVVYNQGKLNEVRSLWDASITIEREEFVIIHGPSGCGKSTLMYALASLQMPTSGEVFLYGKALSSFSKQDRLEFRRTGMGMVFQAFYLIETLSSLENVCLPRVFRSEDKTTRRKAAEQILDRFGILEQEYRYPSQLSGGQKQRVAIARALINNPDIIFADEPVGNLDSDSSRIVLNILRELVEKDKKTVILVTHDPSHLVFGDRIIHMKDGRVTKEEVRKKSNQTENSAVLPKEAVISPELGALMRSFRGLPKEYIQTMLSPFKAHQLMFHFLSKVSEAQWSKGEELMRLRLDNMIGADELLASLDRPLREEGMGLYRQTALALAEEMEAIIQFVKKLQAMPQETIPDQIALYVSAKFAMNWNQAMIEKLSSVLQKRETFEVGKQEVMRVLDASEKQGGVGLNATTAEKIAQEIEIIFLLRY